MSTTTFATSTDNIVLPAYASDFQKAIKKIKGEGETVKRIWGNCVYSSKDGVESTWVPEMTERNGLEFFRKAIPVAKEA